VAVPEVRPEVVESDDPIDIDHAPFSRRAFLNDLLFPSIAGAVGGAISGSVALVLGKRLEQRHNLSISIIPSDDAVSPLFNPFLDPVPPAMPVPGAPGRYTYATLFRNDGDFSEENVVIAVGFQGPPTPPDPLADPQVAFSTPLLSRAVQEPLTRQGLREYALGFSRLNPGEWVSLQVSWQQEMHIVARARSNNFSAFLTQ
jgi:hypothetical protein